MKLTDNERHWLLLVLKKVRFFAECTLKELHELMDSSSRECIPAGQEIVRQGAMGDTLYVVRKGTCSVYAAKPGEQPEKIAVLGPGDYFGEASLLKSQPRNATVTADSAVEVVMVFGGDFLALLNKYPSLRDRFVSVSIARDRERRATLEQPPQPRKGFFRKLLGLSVLLLVWFAGAGAMEQTPETASRSSGGSAPEFPAGMLWLNTRQPLSLSSLRGNTVVLYFFSYSLIHSVKGLAEMQSLERKFSSEPFVLIGIHMPKFTHERDILNLRAEIKKLGFTAPVAADNNRFLWDTYGVQGWPTAVVVNPAGSIALSLAGDGRLHLVEYAVTQCLDEARRNGTLAREPYRVPGEFVIESYFENRELRFPGNIEIDPLSRMLFISDSGNNRVLQVSLTSRANGTLYSVIGTTAPGTADGAYERCSFRNPRGLCLLDNRLFVADAGNHLIREVDLRTRTVTTVAGTGQPGYAVSFSGNPRQASLYSPWDIASDGQYLYIAMAGLQQIWRYDPLLSVLEDFSGIGSENLFDAGLKQSAYGQPRGLAYTSRKLYVADSDASAVRVIDLLFSTVETVAGKGLFAFGHADGPANQALLQFPSGIEAVGNTLFVADTYNDAVRKIDLAGNSVTSLIYRQKDICIVDGKPYIAKPLNAPQDIEYFDSALYIADTNNHAVRVYSLKTGELDTLTISGIR